MDAANQIKALGDLEYRADLEPYLDPVSRYGFDPDVFQMGSQQKGFGPQAYSHYDRMNDTVNISESGLPSKSTQSHEYRHRGFAKLFKQYRKNPEFYEKKYPGIGGLLRELMRGRSGFNETITEFYDTDETYNLPAQYETTTPYSRGRTLGEDAGVVLARGRDYTDDPYVIERKDGLGMQVKKKTKQISGPARLDAGSPEELARRQNFIDYREQAPEDRDTENNMLFNKVLLLEQMAEDEYKNPQNFAQGGEVMQGVGSLNETARNMFRGPSGVGAYQQFANGGEAVMSEAELKRLEDLYGGSMFNEFDLPVDGKVQYRKDRDGSKRFDAEIAKTFDGERGNITPSARYSTQSSSRSMGDVVIDDDGRQIGFAIEGELYLDPDSENKLRGAIDIENSRQKRSFTFPEGQFVKTENGVLKKFNLGADLGMLGLDATYTDDSRRGTRAQGSATIKIGENGIVRYEDSSDGKPQFSAKYSTELGEGLGSFNYKDDSRNVPEYGAELNTSIGEGLGSLSYSTGGKGDRFGVGYTLNFASGGEAMGPPPTRGPDPQGIGYFQQFADGGPVYMQEGGDPFAEVDFDKLTAAVIQTESAGDPNAVSEDDAIGLMQVLPSTGAQPGYEQLGAQNVFDIAIDLGFPIDDSERTVEKARELLFNPKINVAFGTKYLRAMIAHSGGDIKQALQKYNAGTGNYQAFVEGRKPLDQEAVRYPVLVANALTGGNLAMPETAPFTPTTVQRGEDLIMSMPVAQSDAMSPLAIENRREGTEFQGQDAYSAGENLSRQTRQDFGSQAQQDDFEAMAPQNISMRERYSSPNMAAELVGGEEALEEGIGGFKRLFMRPKLRPPRVEFGEDKGGVFRSLMPKYRPKKEYPGNDTDALMRGLRGIRGRTLRKGFTPYVQDVRGELT